MYTLRLARVAAQARPSSAFRQALQKRGYAEAVSDKIRLTLALPHQSIYKSTDVVQVNIPAESGEMGVLANHVPSIEQLKPGLIEIIEESGGSKQFFLSGGFAIVQPGSQLSINAVEGFPLEEFSSEAVRSQITEAQKIAGGSGSEQDVAEAKIELESKYGWFARMKLTSDRQADSMESDGGRHSNSPLSLSIAERSLPIKSPRDQVTKGLVSARIEAYRKQSQRQGNVSHAYPPSFPRARFEEVQTQGNWTSYNAALYNQEHPRTMSLATDASPYTKDISQGSQQNRDAPSQPQAAPTALRPRKVMNLLHQWEDKAGKYDAVNALHPRRAASPRNRSFVAEQPPVNEAYACKTAATQKEVQVPCPKTSAQERVGTSLPRSNILRKEKMEQQPGPFENKALPFAMSNTNNVAKYERSGTVHACSRQSTSHPDKSTAESTCALLEAYEVILPPDKSHTIASSVSFSQARHEANEPSSDPEPIYKDRRSLENQLIEGTIACSPNLDAATGLMGASKRQLSEEGS
ncbi:MAG: hypothetical protein LQ338_002424 [Usnochroma carphineum]|nr:MAG: hypothetical protein LQ338_002424 [Usnochroma carphineum]